MRESDKLRALKKEYHIYVSTVKKVLCDYIHTKEQLAYVKRSTKKDVSGQTYIEPYMPEHHTFCNETSDSQDFIIINRALEHLKQSSLAHIRDYDKDLAHQYVESCCWTDYTDELTQKLKKADKKEILAAAQAKQSKKDFVFSWPIEPSQFWLSSFFGPRKEPNGTTRHHNGIDMAAIKGTTIKAAADGMVEQAYCDPGYGNTIVITHTKKYKTRYAHLNSMEVRVGQKVRKGMIIGRVGDTGNVRKQGRDGSHLHFEVYASGKRVNPLYFLT